MEESGFIEQVPMVYPQVVTRHWAVPKKDGRWRIAGNFVALNRLTCKEAGRKLDPLAIVKQLSSFRYKAKLDLVNGFYFVQTTTNAQQLLGLNVDNKMYVYKRMPMGTSGSPGVFSWFVPHLLSLVPAAIHKNILIYQDDIMIGGSTLTEVTAIIKEIEQVLQLIDARVNEAKSQREATEEISALGY